MTEPTTITLADVSIAASNFNVVAGCTACGRSIVWSGGLTLEQLTNLYDEHREKYHATATPDLPMTGNRSLTDQPQFAPEADLQHVLDLAAVAYLAHTTIDPEALLADLLNLNDTQVREWVTGYATTRNIPAPVDTIPADVTPSLPVSAFTRALSALEAIRTAASHHMRRNQLMQPADVLDLCLIPDDGDEWVGGIETAHPTDSDSPWQQVAHLMETPPPAIDSLSVQSGSRARASEPLPLALQGVRPWRVAEGGVVAHALTLAGVPVCGVSFGVERWALPGDARQCGICRARLDEVGL